MPGQEQRTSGSQQVVDNRMRFIRLLESDQPPEYRAEYEFASEARITGQLNYSNDDLILRLLTMEPNRDGLLKYTLSLAAPAEYRLPAYQSSKDGYYFEGGGSEEILSLVSLHLRCRSFPISYVFRDLNGPPLTKFEHDFNYIKPDKGADKYLFDTSNRNFVTLSDFFDLVKRLPGTFHHRFANAVRLYALALREVGVNDQQAYIHLVSAIEILSKHQVLPEARDPLQGVVDQLKSVLEQGTPEAKGDLGNLLEQRKTMLKFIAFIQEHSDGKFTDRPVEGAMEHKIYKDNLPDALKKIYKARSKYLHEGSSMYLSVPRVTVADCDYDSSMGQTIDNRQFDPEDKLPNLVFFEKLVRECLLSYLNTHQST
ncbi:MAG: hypothetical protein KBE09_01025 [Candidatus Pacebacteria bacterium]|nr:hypothetical protein [Candidatus Paceibacterota bacterium]